MRESLSDGVAARDCCDDGLAVDGNGGNSEALEEAKQGKDGQTAHQMGLMAPARQVQVANRSDPSLVEKPKLRDSLLVTLDPCCLRGSKARFWLGRGGGWRWRFPNAPY